MFLVFFSTLWIELEVCSNFLNQGSSSLDQFLNLGSGQVLERLEDVGNSWIGAVPLSHEGAVPSGLRLEGGKGIGGLSKGRRLWVELDEKEAIIRSLRD